MVPDRTPSPSRSDADYLALGCPRACLAAGLERPWRRAAASASPSSRRTSQRGSSSTSRRRCLAPSLVGVNYRAKSSEIAHMLSSSEAEILIAGGRYRPSSRAYAGSRRRPRVRLGLRAPIAKTDRLRRRSSTEPAKSCSRPRTSETSLVLFTSGTTASPEDGGDVAPTAVLVRPPDGRSPGSPRRAREHPAMRSALPRCRLHLAAARPLQRPSSSADPAVRAQRNGLPPSSESE